MTRGKLLVRLIVQTTVWLAIMGLLLFWPAGNWAWPEAWAFLGIFAAGSALFCGWLLGFDPALLEQRLGSLIQKDQPLWDRLFMSAVVVGWCAWLVAMALDVRWHGAQVPIWVEVVGGVLIVAGFSATVPVFRANSFAAPVVRVQSERQQRVIDSGPYALVRHPMYAAAMPYLIGIPLLLGSLYGLIGSALIAIAIARRAVGEEQLLKKDLTGYADYMAKVRYRLVPYVW
jgi:protein-S-isoprenylcysteine O-methyltransferase Ste14